LQKKKIVEEEELELQEDIAKAKSIFQNYASNSSTTLNSEELYTLMHDVGENVTRAEVVKIVELLDHDYCGKISCTEFIDWLFHSEIHEEDPAYTHIDSLKKKIHEKAGIEFHPSACEPNSENVLVVKIPNSSQQVFTPTS